MMTRDDHPSQTPGPVSEPPGGDRADGGGQRHQQHHQSKNENEKYHETTQAARSNSSEDDDEDQTSPTKSKNSPSIGHRIYAILTWCPPNCRWNPESPPKFSMWLNVLFGFAGAFTVANLYYNHPILNILAKEFGVPYVEVANIPTLAQAGYAAGLLFLCPLGDMVRRRPFVLSLVFATATMCIGLAATSSIAVFQAIQFITGLMTVTPQLMMPLVGDLAPPNRRAFALSIVTTGLMLGILLARLLSGVVTQFTSWRTIYWLSVGLQYLIFILLFLFMPDYPSTNPGQLKGLYYFKMLWSIVIMLTKHPVLVQACLVSYFISSTFTNFWTVLTFLLAGPPYYYTPVVIGLFALIGIAAMFLGPLYAKLVTDRFVPLFTVVLGVCWCMIGICVSTYTGEFTVAGPIIQAFLNDFGMQTSQIANRSAIFTVEPKGRNRVNTAFMVFTFAGQLTGTSVGARLYERGGWVASGSYSVAAMGVAMLITVARGPWEEGWIGWHGGWSIWKKDRNSADGKPQEAGSAPEPFAGTDEEKGTKHHDQHVHKHGHDDQEKVNATEAEKSLEMRAAEDRDMNTTGNTTDTNLDDESAKSKEDVIEKLPKS